MRIKITAMLLLIVVLLGTVAFAMPDEIYSGDVGNTSDLIVITKPPRDRSATFDRSYVISGYGREGTAVAIYTQLSGGTYAKTNYVWQIGASTFFAIPIELDARNNYLIVRAEGDGGSYQHNRLEITYIGSNLSDVMNNITVDPRNLLIN